MLGSITHCELKSTGEDDRLGDAVHTGTGEQGESAALLGTKRGNNIAASLVGDCVGIPLGGLRM